MESPGDFDARSSGTLQGQDESHSVLKLQGNLPGFDRISKLSAGLSSVQLLIQHSLIVLRLVIV